MVVNGLVWQRKLKTTLRMEETPERQIPTDEMETPLLPSCGPGRGSCVGNPTTIQYPQTTQKTELEAPSGDSILQLTRMMTMMWAQQQEERARDETRRNEEREREYARQQEWLELEKRKLDFEEKRWQQHAAMEEAQRATDAQREKERKKDRDLDRRLREVSQLPRMKENEDIEVYLDNFEARLQGLEIPEERWTDNLRPLLSTWALQVIDALSWTEQKKYKSVKDTLLEAYASAKGPIEIRLFSTHREKGQAAAQFFAQQRRLWKRWMEDLDKEAMPEKLAMVQLELALPYTCRNHIRACKPKTGTELVSEIENFFACRNSSWDDPRWNQKPGVGNQRWQQRNLFTQKEHETPTPKAEGTAPTPKPPAWKEKDKKDRLECFICHKPGHFASRCPEATIRINHVETGPVYTAHAKVDGCNSGQWGKEVNVSSQPH